MSIVESTIKTYSGLSSETKPTIAGGTDVPNGSRFREVDTEKKYFFNISDDTWHLFNTRSILYDSINDRQLELELNGGIPVNMQDQTTPPLILPMAQELAATTLSADTVLNAYTMVVTSSAGASIGNHIRIINSAADRYYYGTVLSIVVNTIIVDTQIDFVYISGSEVTFSNINMNVDGSVTPVIFTLRTGSPSIPSEVDITRVLITCITESAVNLSLFGDLSALTRGVAFRSVNGDQRNIFNIKKNLDIASLAYDWTPYVATNPSQGVDGFASRLTFAGQNKMGIALRVGQHDNLEMIVQDDLRGLVTLNAILEGHIVECN